MKSHRFELALAVLLAAICIAFWWWQTPGSTGKLTRGEVDTYLATIEAHIPMEPGEKAEFLARMRRWGETDDGEPVYMLNAMRFFESIKRVPGAESIRMTPPAANAHYEDTVMPILFRLGAYPLFGGDTMGVGPPGNSQSNLIDYDRAADGWNRVLLIRYPSRRAFFRLISDPEYIKVAPYKLAALDVALVPTSSQVVVPDLRWVVIAVSVIAFLGIGWLRSARRRSAEPASPTPGSDS